MAITKKDLQEMFKVQGKDLKEEVKGMFKVQENSFNAKIEDVKGILEVQGKNLNDKIEESERHTRVLLEDLESRFDTVTEMLDFGLEKIEEVKKMTIINTEDISDIKIDIISIKNGLKNKVSHSECMTLRKVYAR